jgi:hypothetical protein
MIEEEIFGKRGEKIKRKKIPILCAYLLCMHHVKAKLYLFSNYLLNQCKTIK